MLEFKSSSQTSFSNRSCPYSLDIIPPYFQYTDNITELEIAFPCEVLMYLNELQFPIKILHLLFHYVAIVLVVTGLILNTLAYLVLRSPSMIASSLSVYLRALAISDICGLLLHTTISTLRAQYPDINRIYKENEWLCFTQSVIFSIFFIYSDWVIVALTYGRLWMLRFPLSKKFICKRRYAEIVVTVTACFCILVGVLRTKLIGADLLEKENPYGYISCQSRKHISWSKAMYYLYVIILVWGPLILTVSGNTYLLIHLRRSAKITASLKVPEQLEEEAQHTTRLTRLLISISGVYVVLFIPIGSMCSYQYYMLESAKTNPPETEEEYIKWKKKIIKISLIRGFCLFVYLWNFVISFFVYSLSGNKFRRAAKVLFNKWLNSPLLRRVFASKTANLVQIKRQRTCAQNKTQVISTLSNTTLISDLGFNDGPVFISAEKIPGDDN